MAPACAPLAAVLLLTATAGTASIQPEVAAQVSTPVTLSVSVTNAGEDRYLDDLAPEDFRVLDDGRAQAVAAVRRERRPVSVCLVFDASMRDDLPAKHRIADAAVRALAASLDPDDEIAALVMRFAPDVRLPLTRAANVTTVDWGQEPHREWGLQDTLVAALDVLDRARHPQRVVLLVSDGTPGGRQVSLPNVVTTRFRSETAVHAIEMVIGMVPDYGPGYMPVKDLRIVKPQLFDSPVRTREPDPALASVVEEGGGLRQRIGDASEAARAVGNLAADLRAGYTVEYTPTRPDDGRFHRVTIELARRDARPRHRAGYLATSAAVRTSTAVTLPPAAPPATTDRPTTPAAPAPAGATPVTAAAAAVPSGGRRPAASDLGAAAVATYEAAVETFRTTRSFAGVEPLVGGWSRERLSNAVSAARRDDPAFAFAAAQFHLEVALDVAPRSVDNAGYHLGLGEQMLSAVPAGRDPAAREFVGHWYAVAVSIYLAQNDLPLARNLADRAGRRAEDSARVQLVLGIIEELQALAFEGDEATLEFRNARLFIERRARLAVAEQVYRRALALEPGYVRATLHLGRVLLQRDLRDEGRRLLEPIADGTLGTTGDRYLATLFLADEAERGGEIERARALLEGIAAFAPGRQTAWLALAQLEQRAGRVERARELVASQLGATSTADEWWAYRIGGLQTEDLAWLRERIGQ